MRESGWDQEDSPVYELYKEMGRKDIKGLDTLKANFREVNGCIFANGNLSKVAELMDTHTLSSNGYNGYISDIEVKVPAGPTSIDIKMTNFFQKQNIPTKVENKKIKIEKEVTLINIGDIVNGTHLKIIELLELCPFKFKVQIKKLWDKGALFGREVVYANDQDTLAKFATGINNMNALALETGFTTEGSLQHVISRVAKGLANVAFTTHTDVAELADLVGFLKDPSKMLAAASSGAQLVGKTETKVVEKKVEEVVEDVNLGAGLFGDDEEDW